MSLSQENRFAPYQSGQCLVSYLYESGLVAMPTGSDSEDTAGQQVLVRTADPFSGRHVVFSLVREGYPPLLPSLEPADDNEVLIRAVVRFAWPMKDVGGTELIRAEGQYEFAHKKPRVPGTDNLPVGRGPYDAFEPKTFFVTPSWFDARPLVDSTSRTYPGGGTPVVQEGIVG